MRRRAVLDFSWCPVKVFVSWSPWCHSKTPGFRPGRVSLSFFRLAEGPTRFIRLGLPDPRCPHRVKSILSVGSTVSCAFIEWFSRSFDCSHRMVGLMFWSPPFSPSGGVDVLISIVFTERWGPCLYSWFSYIFTHLPPWINPSSQRFIL